VSFPGENMPLWDRIQSRMRRVLKQQRTRRRFGNHLYLETANFQSGLRDSAWLLYGLTRSLKPRVCVETGSAQGKSACYVGMALKENGRGKLYAIDPHTKTDWNDWYSVDTLDVFNRNIRKAGVSQYVEMLRGTSAEIAPSWNQEIDLLFIDGDHSYEGVRFDWETFSEYLTDFSITVFHDTTYELSPEYDSEASKMGVARLVDELRKEGYPVLTINQDFGVSMLQATKGGIPLSQISGKASARPVSSL
jgi:predicted O-methyltransferase YrrM